MAAPLLEADFVVARRTFEVVARLHLGAGERLSLFGPSGAGKTTCLEAIAGWVELKQGRIRLDDRVVNAARGRRSRNLTERPVEPRDRGVALVRQPTTLFSHLSVRANVTYGTRDRILFGGGSVEGLLEAVGLDGLGDAMPDALSGGQRQRTSLARAMARPFHALLLDEPFSAVDMPSRGLLRSLAIEASSRAGAVAMLVTHDLTEAQAFGQRLAIMDEGRILQMGSSAELVRQPLTVRVAELCGYRSFVPHNTGKLWALHPDRFVEGAWPERGVVLAGTVLAVQPFGARFSCEMAALVSSGLGRGHAVADMGDGTGGFTPGGPGVVRVHAESPPRMGDKWEVTALDPPLVESVSPASSREE
jgi:ABC-type Fe3+/spermidine/putrescine transport system ATPase subunit